MSAVNLGPRIAAGRARARDKSEPRVTRRLVLAGFGSTFAALSCALARAQERPNVYFAGHAFVVRHVDVATSVPHLARFLDTERTKRLDSALYQRALAARALPGVNLRANELGTLAPGQAANVLALAFDREVVSVSNIGADYKVLVELSFEALIFDYKTKSVVASYPLVAQFIDSKRSEPTSSDIDQILDRLVFGQQGTGVQATFWQALETIRLPQQGARSLRVTDVRFSDAASASLAGLGVDNPEAVRGQFAHGFSKYLAGNQNVAILPFGTDKALGGKMAARLSNGDVFDLKIPDPDYEIRLRLDGLKKVQTAATAAGSNFVYGAFLTIEVVEPLSGRSYFNNQVKLGASRTVPATLESDSDWPSYSEVSQQLFDEFTRALSGPDEAWARQHIIPPDQAVASLKSLKELVDSCR